MVAVKHMPPLLEIHGEADRDVPVAESEKPSETEKRRGGCTGDMGGKITGGTRSDGRKEAGDEAGKSRSAARWVKSTCCAFGGIRRIRSFPITPVLRLSNVAAI